MSKILQGYVTIVGILLLSASPLTVLLPQIEKKDQNIVLILLDDDSAEEMQKNRLHVRSVFSKIINHIMGSTPKVVGIHFIFYGVGDKEEDLRLIKTIESTKVPIVFPVLPNEEIMDGSLAGNIRSSIHNPKIEYANIQVFKNAIFPIISRIDSGTIYATGCKDVIEGVPFQPCPEWKEYLTFSSAIVSSYIGSSFRSSLDSNGVLNANIGGKIIPNADKLVINYSGNEKSYNAIPFSKVLKINPSIFHNKIVLIGASSELTKYSLGVPFQDFQPSINKSEMLYGKSYITPLGLNTPGIVILANSISTIIDQRFIKEISTSWLIVVSTILVLVTSLIATLLKFFYGIPILIMFTLNILLTVRYLLMKHFLLIPLEPLVACIVLSYVITKVFMPMIERFKLREQNRVQTLGS